MSSHAREHPPGDLTGTRPAGPPARPAEGAVRRRLATLGTLLLTFTALPAALLVVPDASGGVVPAAASALALGDAEIPGLLRATGLSLPALLVTVPLAAVAARRLPAWGVLMAGFAVLLAGIGAARLADSLPDIGTVRALQGAGAGIVLPASLVLVWERRNPALSAAWAGALAGTLILAMPLALKAVPVPADGAAVPDWRVALAPYPLLAVAAAGAALAHPLLRGRRHRRPPPLRRTERGPLLLVPVPAGGFAFLAVVAAHGWSPGARLLLAGLTLLALAASPSPAPGPRPPAGPSGGAVVMIAVGLLCQPVAARSPGSPPPGRGPLPAGPPVRRGGRRRPRRRARGHPHRNARRRPHRLPPHGRRRAARPRGRRPRPLGAARPLVPLGAGAGLALAASLRDARVGAALFGLSLCFPAVLAGQLLVLSLQAARLQRSRPVTDAQHVHALLEGYRIWLAVAGVVAVLLAGATARLCAGRAATTRARAPRLSGNATAGPGAG
ncbi:hypothetical protein ACFQY7_25675 [Actinomadura luteofluorescens]|uniref:hypothetical protein n=1 Tax=Actinomadura luteofluorescens TaxID=46163 RepID=UPI003631AEB5